MATSKLCDTHHVSSWKDITVENIPLRSWKLSRSGRFRIAFDLPDNPPADRVHLIFAVRAPEVEEWYPGAPVVQQHDFKVSAGKSAGSYVVDTNFADREWHNGRWNVYVHVDDGDNQRVFEFKFSVKQRRYLYMHVRQAHLVGDTVMFPYLTRRRTLAFLYREREWYDSPWYQKKELSAAAVHRAFHKHFDKQRIWIVYEKKCERAQDNGFYFFKWCMENLPAEERKRIYYVINPTSSDYDRVKPYGRNVLKFLSFRHYLYCIAAEMLVGSETKMHLSPWRSRPAYTKHKLVKTMTFFLQHGVMALKRTDEGLGANGYHPSNYFLVSSEREQQIITDNFGYDAAHVPVLGLARWDALQDRSNPSAPTILLMPTWRGWLSYSSDEEFLETEYYQGYANLLNDPALEACLAEHNATLLVSLHPLFLHLQHLLASNNSHVKIIDPSERPLNEIIMECSAMITDYSSAIWDVVYQGKPALFYQFDKPLYMELTGSYVDFETELPGPCYEDADSLIEGIKQTIEGGFVPPPEYVEKASRWYAHRDRGNCRRIYEYALEIERSM